MLYPFSYLRCLSLFCIFFWFVGHSYAQNDSVANPDQIDKLIKNNSLKEAKQELHKQVAYFKTIKNYDTLPYYVRYYGSYALSGKNWDKALTEAKTFVEELKTYENPSINSKALKELAWIYDETGQTKKAYTILEEALAFANDLKVKDNYRKAELNYNLGFYASIMGDFPRSKGHYQNSLKLIKQIDSDDYEFYQQIYNALGGVMWNEAKMDSSLYYFDQSLIALKKTDTVPINQYYRPALLKMNLAIISHNLGNNTEAIDYSKESIRNFQAYGREGLDEQKKGAARKSALAAIDNLGAFYNAVGEFKKAEELITYSYNEKQKELGSNDANIIISKVILAQAKINTKDLDGAEQLLKEAIQISEDTPGSQLFWYAGANVTLAKVYAQKGNVSLAKKYFSEGEMLQRSHLKGTYNKDFIDELTDMALFYAQNDEHQKAKELIKEIYSFLKEGSLKNTLQDFNTTSTISEAFYEMGDYKEAIKYSDEVINYNYNTNREYSLKKADSILIQFSKPIALLIKAQSNYKLQENPSEAQLKKLLVEVEKGIAIIEERKTIIESHEDVSLMISQNNELFNFAKKLRLDLFKMTGEESYLDDIINLHESNIYRRIRSRLTVRNNIAYSNIPAHILEREKALRKTVSSSLKETRTIDHFFKAQEQWGAFKDTIKVQYPKYYKMKFDETQASLQTIKDNIPKNTTVVRYVFIEEELYTFIISKEGKSIVKLETDQLKDRLSHLTENQNNIAATCATYFELYKQLWEPFAATIQTKDIIIIPDAELYNLSFEVLTPARLDSYKEFATGSLLSTYNISYNYSLLLLEHEYKSIDYGTNIVAFTPEFSAEMKMDYKIALKDSLEIDQSYLRLLPQPFSVAVAQDYTKMFSGDHFKNVNATKNFFINEAREHKIIHIGTHAESNNISPELSRLIFAKSIADAPAPEDNSLYVYEIYNANLSSNLAILTACETGKPSYQPGEGMISLAHAFNYAGSESILTSLWKIDEQSSATIVGYFYENLKEGMSKPEALRQAKLDYLSTNEGRLLQPNYWAGLVLMGDTSPIEIKTSRPGWVWALIAATILIIVILLSRKAKKPEELPIV